MMSFTLYPHLDYPHFLPGLRKGFRGMWMATIPTFLPCGLECGWTTLYLRSTLASTVVLVGFLVAPFRHFSRFGAKLSPREEPSLGAAGSISIAFFSSQELARQSHQPTFFPMKIRLKKDAKGFARNQGCMSSSAPTFVT